MIDSLIFFFRFLFFWHRKSFLFSRTRENFRKLASATDSAAEVRLSVHESRSGHIPSFVGSALSQPKDDLEICRREGGKVRSSREYSSFILLSIFFSLGCFCLHWMSCKNRGHRFNFSPLHHRLQISS